jgi:hypothetical protein
MKTLLIVAGLFFSVCGALVIYFATSDPGHEYDLKLVLPIDARQMPRPVSPPAVVSRTSEAQASGGPVAGRAEAGNAPPIPERPPVQFGDRPGAASEAPVSK